MRTRSLLTRFHKPLSAVAITSCVLMSARAVDAQEVQGPLPEAPGKAMVLKACASCHEIETVIGSRRTKLGWQQSVDDMISRGAEGSKEEMEAVVTYLTAHFGKVNVNTATVQELEKVMEVSEKEAQAIVSYRERNTKIKDFEELKKVPGVSSEKLQAKRGLIAFVG
jgi:competence protein ComEA